jgi:hypothetical protein
MIMLLIVDYRLFPGTAAVYRFGTHPGNVLLPAPACTARLLIYPATMVSNTFGGSPSIFKGIFKYLRDRQDFIGKISF